MRIKILTLAFLLFFMSTSQAYALSVRHHLYNMGRSLTNAVVAPLKGVFVTGPKNVAHSFHYETQGLEQPEKRGRIRNYFFAVWRAPGDQAKGMIDGVTESVDSLGTFSKEFLSIFFSD